MADETNEVRNPYSYFGDPTQGRPLFFGSIYVGEPDTDPENNAAARKQVSAFQEDGSTVPISQPIRTGAGGYAELNGSPVQLVVDGEYSIKVLNKNGVQVFYAPDLVDGLSPSFVVRTQVVGLAGDLPDRVINSTLYATNTDFQTYYDDNAPTMDLGAGDSSPQNVENIPAQRFDLSQGNSTIDLGA
jgi:hypothetical protein